jgi:hypothetical protein
MRQENLDMPFGILGKMRNVTREIAVNSGAQGGKIAKRKGKIKSNFRNIMLIQRAVIAQSV